MATQTANSGQTHSTSAENKERLRNSERFNFPDAEVTFCSADGVIFSIHKKNLDANAGGFPPSQFQSCDELVQLTEDAETLDLLFQSMYPQTMPELNILSFNVLARLAEAAEKYEVFRLMYICGAQMKSILPNHAAEVLGYAAKHGHADIVGEIAPLMLDRPLSEMMKILPASYFAGWVKYIEHWLRVRQSACQLQSMGLCDCQSDDKILVLAAILRKLAKLQSLRDLTTTFDTHKFEICACMSLYVKNWKQRVGQEVARIPKCEVLME